MGLTATFARSSIICGSMADKITETSAPSYTMGYSDEFWQLLNRRSSETHAAHLLPHLNPGMRVLDFGCGPGTISVGLAKVVEPGEIHGIDIEESQVEMARAAAAAGGHDNATFHVGDVTDLPFEDSSFDAAHCHTVLNHVPETQTVLAEVKRVLKSGGIISCRELITASCFTEPDMGSLDALWSTFSALLEINGGHPQMGKELKSAFHEVGFSNIQSTASFESFGTVPDVDFFHGFVIGWFFSPAVIESVTGRGLATQKQFDDWRRSLDKWRDHPGAFATMAWGEALGRKP